MNDPLCNTDSAANWVPVEVARTVCPPRAETGGLRQTSVWEHLADNADGRPLLILCGPWFGRVPASLSDNNGVVSSPHRCLWISPSVVKPGLPPTSAQRFADSVAARGQVDVIGLRVWSLNPSELYDIHTETAAVQDAAARRGWSRYHLYGFSAGATVALATALASPKSVRSIALFEPASIGDDDWSPVETRWRAELARIRLLAPELRQTEFRHLLMAEHEDLPPGLRPGAPWDALTEKLEDMLAHVGFGSGALDRVGQPTLVLSGGRSDSRFSELAARLVQVMPQATAELMADCSHLDPPQRSAPDHLRRLLLQLWDRS